MRRAVWLLGMALVASACSSQPASTSTSAPTSTATTTSMVALPSASVPSTEREAWDLMIGNDVSDLTPEQVRAAGLLIGGHHRGLPFPQLYLSGDEAMRRAVEDVLALPTWWNAQILVGMTELDESRAPGLEATRDEVLTAVFGEAAPLAHVLMMSLISSEQDAEGPGPWYDVPSVVAQVEGDLTESTFEGSVAVASDTGERSDYTVRAVRSGSNDWTVVDGSWLQLAAWAPAYADIDRGPTLSISDLPNLPDETIAVEVAGDVVLLDLDGVALGHLPFFTWQRRRGGPAIVLEDAAGARYGIDGAPLDGYPLAEGAVIVPVESDGIQQWSVVYPDGTRVEVVGDWRVDATGRVVTPDFDADSAYDVVARRTVDVTPGCWVADASRPDWVLACDFDDRSATIETLSGRVLVGDEQWGVLYEASEWPWPLPDGLPVAGHWDGLIPSGDRWLGKWSGECESEDGFLVTDGAAIPLGGPTLEEAPSASVGGWTSDGRAVFSLYGEGAGCEQAADVPGVYLAEPGASPTLLWDSGGRTVHVSVWERG